MLGWRFVPTGNERLYLPPKLLKIVFDQGSAPEDLGYRQKEGDWQDQQDR